MIVDYLEIRTDMTVKSVLLSKLVFAQQLSDPPWTRTGPTPKYFFWDFWSGIFAQNSILVNYSRSWKNILGISIPSSFISCISVLDNFWSNLGFRVKPLLVQPRVSSTVRCFQKPSKWSQHQYDLIHNNLWRFL